MAIAKGIRRASMQKSRASIEYIKTRIRNVYKGLIWKLRPPEDWKERLRNEESDWTDLYERIWDVRNGVRELENILDKYHYLEDEELTNDVLEIIRLLEISVFLMASNPEFPIKEVCLTLRIL